MTDIPRYICNNCGKGCNNLHRVESLVGEYWGQPAYEEYYVCPFCGSDDVDDYEGNEEEEPEEYYLEAEIKQSIDSIEKVEEINSLLLSALNNNEFINNYTIIDKNISNHIDNYYDNNTYMFAKNGKSLRHRTEKDGNRWTLKSPLYGSAPSDNGLFVRFESGVSKWMLNAIETGLFHKVVSVETDRKTYSVSDNNNSEIKFDISIDTISSMGKKEYQLEVELKCEYDREVIQELLKFNKKLEEYLKITNPVYEKLSKYQKALKLTGVEF